MPRALFAPLVGRAPALACGLVCGLVAVRPADTRADTPAADAARSAATLSRTVQGIGRLVAAVSDLERVRTDFTVAYDEFLSDVMADPVLRELFLGTARLYQGKLSYAAYGAVVAESTQFTAVGAGAELAWDAPLCRFAGAGADLQLYRETEDGGFAADAHATACIPLPANTPELTYRLQRSVRPALSARPVLRPGRYSADTGSLALAFYKWRGELNQIDIAPLTFEIGYSRELDVPGLEANNLFHAEFEIHTVRWRRRGRGFLGGDWALDFFPIRIRTLEDATVGWFAPIRLSGISLGGGLYLDAEVAYTGGDLPDASGAPDPNMPVSQVVFRTAGVDVSLRAGEAYRHGGLRYERKVEPTTSSTFLLDDRVTAWVTWQARRTSVTTRGFVASTSVVDRDGAIGARILTGGGEAELSFAISRIASFSMRGELARSFFSRIDVPEVTPELGFRAMAVLSAATSSVD